MGGSGVFEGRGNDYLASFFDFYLIAFHILPIELPNLPLRFTLPIPNLYLAFPTLLFVSIQNENRQFVRALI